ncbi:MAG: Hsp70 family protein [Arsenophonus endosymbiont of Dermacentor nuttalli]
MSSMPHQRRLAAGIDLGTTNSLITTVRSGMAATLADPAGYELLPSIVSYQPTGITVGWQAKAKVEQDPINSIISVKRLLGRSLSEIQQSYPSLPYRLTASKNDLPLIHTVIGQVDPIQVSSEILKSLAP